MLNPLFNNQPNPFGSVKIIQDMNMVDIEEDWTEVRSHSRAKRRRAKGYPQRIKIIHTPKKEAIETPFGLVMHPEMANALRKKLEIESVSQVFSAQIK